MRNKTFTILMLLALLIAPNFAVFSQTSNSPPAKAAKAAPVSVDETIAFLLKQNEDAKAVIAGQENQIQDLRAELAVERENSASVSKSYAEAEAQIKSLAESNESLRRAVAVNESTISMLQTDNQREREKAKKAARAKWRAYGVAAAAIALKILLP